MYMHIHFLLDIIQRFFAVKQAVGSATLVRILLYFSRAVKYLKAMDFSLIIAHSHFELQSRFEQMNWSFRSIVIIRSEYLRALPLDTKVTDLKFSHDLHR